MSLSLVDSVRSCVKRAAMVVVGLCAVFASGGAWATDYTWCGGAVGDETNWYNPTNWGKTAVNDYPKTTSDKAIIPASLSATITLTNSVTIHTLTFNAGCSFALTGVATPSGIPQLKMNSGLTDNGVVKLALDGVYFYRDTSWTPKAGSSIELTNGAKLYLSDFYLTTMDSVSLSGGSWMSVNTFSMNGAARTLTIDDSTFNVRSHGYFGTANPGGGKVVFKGAHPLLRVAGVFRSNYNAAGMTEKMRFDFEVPVGGFAEVPVQSYGEIMMNNQGNIPAGYMQWTVLTTSPALSAETELDFCAYMNPRGMYRGRASNGDATTATMRFAADSPDVAATSDTAATLLYLTLGSGEPATEASHSGGILDYKTTSIARHVITATGWITAVATDGNTSQLELWVGEANNTATMTLADSCEPDRVGKTSLSFTAPEAIGEKTYYFQFRLYDVNGSVTNYTASTGTFSAATKDETIYTWKAKDGDWTGDWDDPDHWSTTVTTARGYPYTANSIAKFPRGHKIAVTINDNRTVGTVDCSDYNPDDRTDVIDVTLRGKEGEGFGTNKVLTVSNLGVGAYGGHVMLDRAAVKVSNDFSIGCDRTLDIANGSWFYTAKITSNAGGTFLIRGDSYVSANGMLQENVGSSLVIEDAKFYLREHLQHATANSTSDGGTVRFRGTHPVMRFAAGKCINHKANGAYTLVYTFEVPVGGYAAAPIQTDDGTCDFPQWYGANFLKFEIDPASPCYLQTATFDTPLVAWPGSAKVLTTGKNIFGTLPDGGYFAYGTSGTPDYGWTDVASFAGTAKAIGAHVVSVPHNDKLTVATDCGVAIADIDPAVGEASQSEVASGSVIIFSAPASYEASGVRYTRTGYTLSEFTKTASGTTTNVTTGTDGSFNYTVANKEVLLTWHYTKDYKVTSAVVNDADASVEVTSGSGYVTDTTPVTLTAATSSETMEFQYWYGDLPYTNRYTNPLTLKGAKAMSVTAFFGKKKANGSTIVASAGEVQPASPWFATSTWTGGVIPGTNDTAVVVWTKENGDARWRFKVEVPTFFAVGNLEISNACVRINNAAVPSSSSFSGAVCNDNGRANSSVSDATDKQRYESIGCDVFGDLTIDSIRPAWNNSRNGGYLMVGGTYQQCPSKVVVKGDLTLANGSILVAAGYRFDNLIIDASKAIDGPNGFLPFTDYRAFFRGENVLRVGGKTTLKTPTIAAASHRNVIYTVNEFRTGAAVWLDLQDVEVQAKAGFTAYQGGYGKFDASGSVGRSYSMCTGGHCAGDNTSGGSYGGAGGSEESVYPAMKPTSHMATYGYANAPYYPGSHNGGDGGLSHPGAGSIRLDCGVLTLDGALMANGMEASGNKGGSSGGGIWVACSQFVPGADCAIEAKGGNASGNNSGGGGGRVSICEGLTAEQVESLFTNELHTATDATVSSLADKLGARFSAAGGTGTTSRSNGYDGTGVYIVNTAGKKTVTVVGDPSNLGAPEPAYGPHVVEQNAVLSLAGPEDAYVSDDNRSRRSCAGYVITDTDGNVLVNSDSRTGSYTVTKDCTITWKLTTLVHKLAVEVTAGGSVTTNQIASADDPWQTDGSTISLTAVPLTGYAFAGWYGDLPTNLQANATLVFPSTKGRTVKALFVTTAAGAVAWTGAGDGTRWEDAANWDGGAIPGAASDVTIPNGANVTANFCVPVSVKSLTVAAGASLTFGPNSAYSTYSKPRVAENAVETDWQRIKLTVANDFTVNGTFTIGGKFSLAKFELDVGGALVFGAQARGNFYAAYNASQAFLDSPTKRYDNTQADMELAAQYAESAWVTVGGTFSVATNAVVALWSEFYSGASVRFDVGSLLVANGGKIDADGKGWGYVSYSDLTYSLSPTLIDGSTYGYGGGTYGGLGGYSDTHVPSFKVYGWAYAPLLPGSPGFNTYSAPGGGVVRIHAKESLRCYGTITAIGATSDQYFCNSYCGSGGGIFLTGSRIRTGEKTVITADGQSVLQKNNSGAGAGGRLVIGLRLSDADLAELCASGTCTRLGNKVTATDLMAGLPASWKGTVTAKGGVNERTQTSRRYSGEDGTAYLLQGPQSGFTVIVR